MESKTSFDIIQLADNVPNELNRLIEDFLAIETNFNLEEKKLGDKKGTILSEFDSTINFLKKQELEIKQSSEGILNSLKSSRDNKIFDLDKNLNEGTYVRPIVSKLITRWIHNGGVFEVLRWIALGIGVVLFFAANWYVGILVGAGGYLLLNLGVRDFSDRITKANVLLINGASRFSEADRMSLKNISSDIREDLEKESDKVKINNEVLKKTIEQEYNSKREAELIDQEKKLKNIEEKRQSENLKKNQTIEDFEKGKSDIIDKLRVKTNEDIQSCSTTLNNIANLLNQIPETFDSNSKPWSSEDLFKGKDAVSSNLRIGSEKVKIDIGGEQHLIDVPKLISFLNRSNLAFSCKSQNETNEAIRISHNIISRVLLSLPASKTKLTFIDPLELGANAAPFTPLLREIYGGMVFTQQIDIENQLSILTRAIENVIQRYLQDKFEDLAEYNFKTKEVPEPYRLLAVYNFPHGFNDTTANKLLNIIKSGPKAGVHTILVSDRNAKLPYGIDWKVFEGINIKDIPLPIIVENTTHGHFEFDENLPFTEIVDYINSELPKSSGVKIPFTKYINERALWWKDTSCAEISIPIGRHATDLFSLSFKTSGSENPSQALLIGAVGSGKSNLLHVIIANSIWKYSPDELEIYLIDFKGGVEFSIYAEKRIPHIKAIAIESEREFGLSVLEKIENIMLERQNILNELKIQNIKQLKEVFPDKIMPRILLIVDEFQKFYSDDDYIKNSVDRIFDNIVRQGRAFGINTIFASQTLAGFSILKSTKELIEVRIALRCAEDDALRIFEERNNAAKDLTLSGQGVYNAKMGKPGFNNNFQALYIEDNRKDLIKHLCNIEDFSKQNYDYSNFKQIIFRGSEKVMIEKDNHPLKKITALINPSSLFLWVGEPVAIADDVTVVLRKQDGSNLLVTGYDEKIGLRLMCSSIISIATQHLPKNCLFYSFNFYNLDSGFVNVHDELFNNIDQDFIKVNSKKIKETLQAIKKEIENRLLGRSKSNSNIYLCLFSLQRGRALRKDGFSMNDEGNLLAYILKEGADVGVFSLVQVDSMDSFAKNLDEDLLREFSHRIASQMNIESSVRIIGSEKAANLKNNRALYYDDNENKMIKFKPYELPTFSWIKELKNPQATLS